MSNETNEFENGPTGEADSDSIQSPDTPDHPLTDDSTDVDTDFEAYAPDLGQDPAGETEDGIDSSDGAPAGDSPSGGAASDGSVFDDAPAGDSTGVSGIAPPAPAPGPRRLVRDPYSRLGGVASGVAHYYGVDVVLVRLLFVAFVLFTGFGVLLYLLAWLIVPRAEYWPPVPPKGGTRAGLDNRQIALGLIGVGVVIAAFASGGPGSQVVIALGLIGAGVWMFTQSPDSSDEPTSVDPASEPATVPVGAGVGASSEYGASDTFVSGYHGGGGPPATPPPVDGGLSGYPAPQPVPRRRRRIWPLIVFPLILLVLPLLVVGTLIAFVASGDAEVELGSGDSVEKVVKVSSVDELLNPIENSIGSTTLDLTLLETADFADYDTPVEVDIVGDLGEVVVLVPEDLGVAVQADVDLGEITAFGQSVDGLAPSLEAGEGDPVVELDIEIDIGSIDVRRVAE